MPEAQSLTASYAHCRSIARAAARNFYYGFLLLPREKRDALCALYAFMREVDDIADTPGEVAQKRRGLAGLRAAMDRALGGERDANPLWPAFCDTISHYSIPSRYLHDLISGAEMDQAVTTYATFDQLREYCYRVAGTVGLCCVCVFGFEDPRAPELAETLGVAFQLTNILRDLPRDLAMGRVYLPQEDLERFECSRKDLSAEASNENFFELVRFETDRAWELYREGWHLVSLIHEDSRAALWALARIYSGILAKIEEREYDVLNDLPAGLTTAEKVWILARARLGWRGDNDVLGIRDHHRRRAGGNVFRRRAG